MARFAREAARKVKVGPSSDGGFSEEPTRAAQSIVGERMSMILALAEQALLQKAVFLRSLQGRHRV